MGGPGPPRSGQAAVVRSHPIGGREAFSPTWRLRKGQDANQAGLSFAGYSNRRAYGEGTAQTLVLPLDTAFWRSGKWIIFPICSPAGRTGSVACRCGQAAVHAQSNPLPQPHALGTPAAGAG